MSDTLFVIILCLGLGGLGLLSMAVYAVDRHWRQRLQREKLAYQERLSAQYQKEQEALKQTKQTFEEERNKLAENEQELATARQQADNELRQQQAQVEAQEAALRAERYALAELTPENARQQVLEHWQKQLATELESQLKAYHNQLESQKKQLSQQILLQVMQRHAPAFVREATLSTVPLPSSRMRGRVIGPQGRNIQALQKWLGVDLRLEDDKTEIEVSSFDPLRRTLACRTLNALLADGRIDPIRIEQAVQQEQQKLEQELPELGQAAADACEVNGLSPALLKALGRLNYSTSYGQNNLLHAQQVSRFAAALALELGADVEVARRAGLLHDLGKGLIASQPEQSHTQLGVELARKEGEPAAVLHAMEAHHFEVQPTSPEAVIVQIADTLSAARPGARSESIKQLFHRQLELEKLAKSFAGVEKVIVLQAGRELHVMVDPDQLTEAESQVLAQQIAHRLQESPDFSGQIKVYVVREIQFVNYRL